MIAMEIAGFRTRVTLAEAVLDVTFFGPLQLLLIVQAVAVIFELARDAVVSKSVCVTV
jgi:hypothetical protein